MPEAPNAVRELAEDATSRKKFLRKAGGTGVAASLAAFIAACGGDVASSSSSKATPAATTMASGKSGTEQFGEGDLGIANYALTLEYLEADFYSQAAESGMLKGKALELGKMFGEQEQEHVDALEAMIKKAGGKPPAKPKGKFPLDSQKDDPRSWRRPSRTSAPPPTSARRARSRTRRSWPPRCRSTRSRRATRRPQPSRSASQPTPDGAFAKPATADEVLKAVKPYIAT